MFAKEQEREIYDYWLNNVKNFKFTHTTSSIIAEEILKKGLDPGKRLNIFKDAIRLNVLLQKYALFGIGFLSSNDLERNYFFLSPKKIYGPYKIPESLDHLLLCAKGAIEKLRLILDTDGDFILFQQAMIRSGVTYYTTMKNYKRVDFRKFREDFNEILLLTAKIKDFEKRSTSVTLFVDNEAVLDLLPEKLKKILSEYTSFRKTIFLWHLDKPKDVNAFIEGVLGSNELLVMKKISKKYICRFGKI